ncbi:MAG: DUF853 family protein [Bacteroidetes bacterium]|nr:DUF853 family protein [Bacteroidota bacterium]MBU1580137.1 DUF853 family protein [Bacteroidota bacterium]MBU2558419.1 DUF853 family protein [Bacteroidota bacterium]
MKKLLLGFSENQTVELDLKTIQRHIACFGASGSGKTVACKVLAEELALQGIPMIIFDPQGDIASLINPETDDELLASKGLNPDVRQQFSENAEVLIWTPGSSKGLPLSINPLQFEQVAGMDAEDRLRFFSATAKNVIELIGYDADNDDGKSAESVLSTVFDYCFQKKIHLDSFAGLIDLLTDLPESVNEIVTKISNQKDLQELIKKLRFLTIGSRKLIFETGYPATIEALLGLGDHDTGKTRLSVIYLNTLSTQEEKEFFMAYIAQLLYNWMLQHPLQNGQDGLQAALYIDEIAPYLPPVKMPSCKESLMLLFKQARKYGVGCLIATQNPGDIDYKSIAQISTYLIGSLKTKQDLTKIETRIESMAPNNAAELMQKIPALKKGAFLLLSPDEAKKIQQFQVRWLLTKHDVISEEQLNSLIDESLRERYQKSLMAKVPDAVRPTADDSKIDDQSPREEQPDSSIKTAEEQLFVVDFTIREQNLRKVLKPQLEHKTLNLIVQEKLESASFDYYPLLKASMVFNNKKGLFRKKIEQVSLNLYLDYKQHDILMIEGRKMIFKPLIEMDPHKIDDLDGLIMPTLKTRSELDYDFRKLGKKLDVKEVKQLLERKYDVEVNEVSLLLYPVWHCRIQHKTNSQVRHLTIDAVMGYPLIINPLT